MLENKGWMANSACLAMLRKAKARDLSDRGRHDLGVTMANWLGEFPAMDHRTRANIVATFTWMADGFMRGALHDLFCTDTSFVPELTHHGAVIVLVILTKVYLEYAI